MDGNDKWTMVVIQERDLQSFEQFIKLAVFAQNCLVGNHEQINNLKITIIKSVYLYSKIDSE